MSRKTCNRPKNKKKNGPKNENHMARISNQRKKKKTKSVTSETSISVKNKGLTKKGRPSGGKCHFSHIFRWFFSIRTFWHCKTGENTHKNAENVWFLSLCLLKKNAPCIEEIQREKHGMLGFWNQSGIKGYISGESNKLCLAQKCKSYDVRFAFSFSLGCVVWHSKLLGCKLSKGVSPLFWY